MNCDHCHKEAGEVDGCRCPGGAITYVSAEFFDYIVCDGVCDSPEAHSSECAR